MSTATGTTRTAPARRTQALRLPRTTGALSGLLIIVLGVWGGLIPFIGPYFHYAFGGTQTWHYTAQRLWLDIVPGAVAVVGGLMLLSAASRIGGLTAAWVAIAAGVWFVIGPAVSILWHHSLYAIGAPLGGATRQMLEWVGYFFGLGAVIVGFAAFAMGRYFSRPRVVEELPVAAADAVAVHEARADERRVADEPRVADESRVADEPATATTTPAAASTTTRPRRRFGLFGRRRNAPVD
jgi:hypothetical protein